MSGRATTDIKRAHGAQALPKAPKPSPAQNVQSFDGRAKTEAGTFEREARMQDMQGAGYVVEWRK